MNIEICMFSFEGYNKMRFLKLFFVLGGFLYSFSNIVVMAATEISSDGINYETSLTSNNVNISQTQLSNIAIVIDKKDISDSMIDSSVEQVGYYNRAVIFQNRENGESNYKYAEVKQLGSFNRLLIVQIGDDEEKDMQETFVLQKQNLSLNGSQVVINNATNRQTYLISNNQVSEEDNALVFFSHDEVKDFAKNFVFAPELSRIGLGLIDNISSNFSFSVQENLDKTRFFQKGKQNKFFLNTNYARSKTHDTTGILGYNQDVFSAVLGAHTQVSSPIRLGAVFNLSKSNADINRAMGEIDTNGYQLAGIGSFVSDKYYVDIVASIGRFDFSTQRFSDRLKVTSDFSGWNYTGRVQSGYFFDSKYFQVGPLVSLTYAKSYTDDYIETGNINLSQGIYSQGYKKLTASFGSIIESTYKINNTSFNSSLKFEIEKDFGIDKNNLVTSYFLFSPNDKVHTPVEEAGIDVYGRISGSLDVYIGEYVQFSLGGMALVNSDKSEQRAFYSQVSILH